MLQSQLRAGGLLVVASPYTWRPEHTPVSNWLGGTLKDAENHFTVDGLKEALGPELVLLQVLFIAVNTDQFGIPI